MKNQSNYVICSFLLLFLLINFFSGCSSNTIVDPWPKLYRGITKTSECKSKVTVQKALLDSGTSKDCIDYQWDGKGTLTFRHVNAAFNCCPGSIIAGITTDSNAININEQELKNDCRCDCLYDIDYAFHNLRPGSYTITINEPYRLDSEPLLQLNITLPESQLTGTFCVDRAHYPWGL